MAEHSGVYVILSGGKRGMEMSSRWNSLTEQQRMGITLGVLLALVMGMGAWLWFSFQTRNEISVEQGNHDRHLEELKKKLSHLPALEIQFKEQLENLAKSLICLPDDREVEALWDTISEYRMGEGISLAQLQGDQQGGAAIKKLLGDFEEISYSLGVEASFKQLGRFIDRLEQHKRLIAISDLQVMQDSKTMDKLKKDPNPSLIHKIRMKLTTYRYKPSQPTTQSFDQNMENKIAEKRLQLSNAIVPFSPRFQPSAVSRDPFLPTFTRISTVSTPTVKGKSVEEQLAEAREEAAELLQKIRAADQNGKLSEVYELMEKIDQVIKDGKQLAEQLGKPEDLKRFAEIEDTLAVIKGAHSQDNLDYLQGELGQYLRTIDTEMEAACIGELAQGETADHFDRVKAVADKARKLIDAYQKRCSETNEQMDREIVAMEAKLERLRQRSDIVREFMGKPLVVVGAVYFRDQDKKSRIIVSSGGRLVSLEIDEFLESNVQLVGLKEDAENGIMMAIFKYRNEDIPRAIQRLGGEFVNKQGRDK